MVVHHLPVARCAGLLAALTGAAPSAGFVHGLPTRAATVLGEADRRIRALITLAVVVVMDETPLRVGPRLPRPGRKKAERHMLVACTDLYTRGSCSVTATWPRSGPPYSPSSPPPRSSSTIRYHLYDHELFTADPADTEPGLDPDEADAVVFVGLVHQLCTQHIYPDQAWPVQIADALRGLVHHTNTTRHDTALATGDGHDPAHCRHCQPTGPAVPLDELRRRFRQGVLVGLAHTTDHGIRPGERPARLLLETLHTREDDVLRFLTDPTIPPTSNDAERALRPAKIQQNISGRLTSETVTQDRYTILGYLSTAAKHGLDIMTALRQTFGGRP